MKKNDILLLFYSMKSGSLCQYIGTEQLRDMYLYIACVPNDQWNNCKRIGCTHTKKVLFHRRPRHPYFPHFLFCLFPCFFLEMYVCSAFQNEH